MSGMACVKRAQAAWSSDKENNNAELSFILVTAASCVVNIHYCSCVQLLVRGGAPYLQGCTGTTVCINTAASVYVISYKILASIHAKLGRFFLLTLLKKKKQVQGQKKGVS